MNGDFSKGFLSPMRVFAGCVLRTRTATVAYYAVVEGSYAVMRSAHPTSFLQCLNFQTASKGFV
jgi:hypothetical protein